MAEIVAHNRKASKHMGSLIIGELFELVNFDWVFTDVLTITPPLIMSEIKKSTSITVIAGIVDVLHI